MYAKALLKPLLLSLLFCAISSPLALAQNLSNSPNDPTTDANQRWYQVEMIVFSRSESTAQQEIWRKNFQLGYPANLILLKPTDSTDQGFVQLKATDRQLNAQAASIAKSGSYTLLFHQAWRQLISSQKTSIFIGGGKTYSGHQELEGSIDLSVGQYLQLHTNLWLSQFISAQAAVSNEAWPELPPLPSGDLSGEGTGTNSDLPAEYVSRRTVKIEQERSMRSGEVHYLDHPLLGIILKIVPYDAPNL